VAFTSVKRQAVVPADERNGRKKASILRSIIIFHGTDFPLGTLSARVG